MTKKNSHEKNADLYIFAVIKLDSSFFLAFYFYFLSLVECWTNGRLVVIIYAIHNFFMQCLVMTFECGFDKIQKGRKRTLRISYAYTHFYVKYFCRYFISSIFWIFLVFFSFRLLKKKKMLKVMCVSIWIDFFYCCILIRHWAAEMR